MKAWLRRSLIALIFLGSLVLGMAAGEVSSVRTQSLLLAGILISITYLWAKELIGRWWALLPTYILAFSSTLLAGIQGGADILALSLSTNLAILSFLSYLLKPNWFNFIVASLSFGFAIILSLEALVFIPYFFLIAILFYFVNKKLLLLPMLGILIFGFVILGVFAFLMETNVPFYVNDVLEALQNLVRNSAFQWPTVFLYKEPMASLILIMFALVSSLFRIIRATFAFFINRSRILFDYLTTHFTEFALIIFAILWVRQITVAIQPLTIASFLPLMPSVYILTASAIRRWFSLEEAKKIRNFMVKLFIMSQELLQLSIKGFVLTILLIWYLFSAISAAPNFSSYTNILGYFFLSGP